MTTLACLVAGRLGLAVRCDREGAIGGAGPATRSTYGASRLGLHPPLAARSSPRRPERRRLRKKGTYRLPTPLLRRLKVVAATTDRYQYAIVAEALRRYLGAETGAPAPRVAADDRAPPAQEVHLDEWWRAT